MRKHEKAILLMVLCTLFSSVGQLLFKLGINQATSLFTIINLPFIAGVIAYGVGAFLMLLSFSLGELSVLYPVLATSYIWVSIASPYLFPDDGMNAWKWAGIILIIISVSLLGRGTNDG